MATKVHFFDVGQGNMTLVRLSNKKVILYDCNITEDNEERVLDELKARLPGEHIDIFANSHRDADHFRGVRRIHEIFPIKKIWDSGVTGGTPGSTEYREYMQLRRDVGYVEVKARTRYDFGRTRVRVMNSKNDELSDNANTQSVVLKIEQHDSEASVLSSCMLAGDTDALTWRNFIMRHYKESDLSSNILLASHHGSITFFDDPNDDEHYYTSHLRKISPAMTIVSVGDNGHGHPDKKAIKFYAKYSKGSNKGNKVYRTDKKGTVDLTLKSGGGWNLRTSR